MKKVLAIVLALALTLATAVPVLATVNGRDVNTGVTIEVGGGEPPVIKCKWEEPDMDATKAGIQINPPGVFNGTVNVRYYVVVTDPEDGGNVGQVWVDVYHPPESCLGFKYEIPLVRLDKSNNDTLKQEILAQFTAAHDAGLVTYNASYNYSEVWTELDKCTADLWIGDADLTYHQPAGNYTVEAYVIDQSGNQVGPLVNQFEYVPLSLVEIDFNALIYGSTRLCKEKWIAGDTTFNTPVAPAPNPNPATVRNIGNTCVFLTLNQTDMGFNHVGTDPTTYQGQTPPTQGVGNQSTWNVVFDARLGSNVSYQMYYDPYVTVTLPNKLCVCNTDELDFSIHVYKGTPGQSYTGNMTISCLPAPFDCED